MGYFSVDNYFNDVSFYEFFPSQRPLDKDRLVSYINRMQQYYEMMCIVWSYHHKAI